MPCILLAKSGQSCPQEPVAQGRPALLQGVALRPELARLGELQGEWMPSLWCQDMVRWQSDATGPLAGLVAAIREREMAGAWAAPGEWAGKGALRRAWWGWGLPVDSPPEDGGSRVGGVCP